MPAAAGSGHGWHASREWQAPELRRREPTSPRVPALQPARAHRHIRDARFLTQPAGFSSLPPSPRPPRRARPLPRRLRQLLTPGVGRPTRPAPEPAIPTLLASPPRRGPSSRPGPLMGWSTLSRSGKTLSHSPASSSPSSFMATPYRPHPYPYNATWTCRARPRSRPCPHLPLLRRRYASGKLGTSGGSRIAEQGLDSVDRTAPGTTDRTGHERRAPASKRDPISEGQAHGK
jgi:hypothetical protein